MASMDFFEAQDRARSKTGKLVVLYILAVLAIIITIYLVVNFFFAYRGAEYEPSFWSTEVLWDPQLLLLTSFCVLAVILVGTWYRVSQLSKGGSAVAEMAGGRKVDLSTDDLAERRLVNVVEEMSIASGVPVPAIYILDDEEGINAFAAGFSSRDAAVAVTRGTLNRLTREELQGVIAHEFSHIFNGDMRLNIRLIGILNGILVLHVIGMIIMRGSIFAPRGGGRSSGSGEGGKGGGAMAILVLGLVLLIVGYIGMLFGRMIQAAVSRQREYLADAAAVQYTRNPDGIGGALRKIGGMKGGSNIKNGHSSEFSHMFFAKGLRSGLNSVFSTHPPLEKRIGTIGPSEEAGSKEPSFQEEEGSTRKEEEGTDEFLQPEFILAAVGSFGKKDIAYAQGLLRRIPNEVREAVHEPLRAEAICYGILLHQEEALKDEQLAIIREKAGKELASEVERLHSSLRSIEREWVLPLIDMALPALKQMSERQYGGFKESVRQLIEADEKVSIFEYALEKILIHNLDASILEKPDPKVRYKRSSILVREMELLLSALAHRSTEHPEEAWQAGIDALAEVDGPTDMSLIPKDQLRFQDLDRALDALAEASGAVRKEFITAAVKVAYADGRLDREEMELMRAMAEAIDCPMPISGSGNEANEE